MPEAHKKMGSVTRTGSFIDRVHGAREDTLSRAAQPREAERGWNRRLTPNSGDGSRVMAPIFGY